MAESRRSLYLAGMKETEGERIVNAIQKLADKIRKLENDRQRSKAKVESLNVEEIPNSRAANFFQRLAKAEARCQALQQQLAHVRKIVRNTSSIDADDNATVISNQSVDNSSTFDSLPSVILDASTEQLTRQDSKNISRGRIRIYQHQNGKLIKSTSALDILELPVHHHFKRSVSSNNDKDEVLPTRDHGSFEKVSQFKMNGVDKSHRHPVLKERLQKELDNKIEKGFSDNSSLILKDNAIFPITQSHKRRRSLSQTRSGAGTPLGQFLPSSTSKPDVLSHYHVKMKEIPFCSTTTSGKSHSLGANLQNLMSMVKVCHPSLCDAAPLHRRRSRSVERRSPFPHSNCQHTIRRNMTRWNSASALDSLDYRQGHRGRSQSLESTPFTTSLQNHSDLDIIPVKLKANKVGKEKCETAGNVCIKTEIKPLPVGSNRVVEVKMTTSAKPKNERPYRGDTVAKRRELLKDVRDLQYMVENDKCC